MADWLAACGVTTVALESTGVSWIPLCELLATRGFKGLLGDAPPVQQSQGRPKSEVHAGPWRQRLPPVGRLASAFRPPAQGCVRRSSRRPRALWLTSAGQPLQPRHKALTPMPLKRQHGVSDVTGETGLASMRASATDCG